MANVNLPFESLLSATGISELKTQLDQILARPQDTGVFVFKFLLNEAGLPQELPVIISKEADKYVIKAANDLLNNPQEFLLHDLQSAINKFELKLNEIGDQVEDLILEAESELSSLRDRVSHELSKIPFSIAIRENAGNKEFFIHQTREVEAVLNGVEITIKESSLTFTSSAISQLHCSADLFLKELKAANGVDPHPIALEISYASGVFNGSAVNIPDAKLQGITAKLDQVTIVIQNERFQAGTAINGQLVFDFLDAGQGGASKIDFDVSIQDNGDIIYEAQNPEGHELKKGSLSLFFEQLKVISHTSNSTDVHINGWAQVNGLIDSSTQQAAKTTFDFQYADPFFEFTGTEFAPIPLSFSTIEFDTVFLKIHKDGDLEKSDWKGKMEFPVFNDGELDFLVKFENESTNKLKVEVTNPTGQALAFGGVGLNLSLFELHYENNILIDVLGEGALTIPVITTATPILTQVIFNRAGQNEDVRINAVEFGVPTIAGCQVDFSEMTFLIRNGILEDSQIKGRLKLPDSTDGAGLGFVLDFENQGNDYTILLDGTQEDNELNFGPIQLSVDDFELKVAASQLQRITGEGAMQLPGLSEAFDFDLDVQLNGALTIYEIQVNNAVAQLSGFNLTFTQINLISQSSQHFQASALGSLTLPVFEEGGALSFEASFGSTNSYQININSGQESVKFGDFKLSQVVASLQVEVGVLQNFSADASLKIPGFESESEVQVLYSHDLSQYKFTLKNPLEVDFFGGNLNLVDFQLEVLNESFVEGSAAGVFHLPDATGGAGIQFEMNVGDDGKSYTLQLTGDPADNAIEFGPVSLWFQAFLLKVEDGELESVIGGGSLFFPGLNEAMSFAINVDRSGPELVYIIEVLNADANLASLNLHFDQIRIESNPVSDFAAAINGALTLPAFDGTPLNFDIAIARDNNYTIQVDGLGQNANFGIFVMKDLDFSIAVTNGVVQNSTGSAKFHIPELTTIDDPFQVGVVYSKNGTEDFVLAASNLPAVDLTIFTLDIATLAFLIRDGAFESGLLQGNVTMPFFTEGGSLNFNFAVQDGGNSYKVNINSEGVLAGNSLEIKELLLELEVNNAGVQNISGESKFKLPAADDFIEVGISYSNVAGEKLSFSAHELPTFSIGDLQFDFSDFGFAILNGDLSDVNFEGNMIIPACEEGNNALAFKFEMSDGDDYTIQANPGAEETELKLDDISLFISKFDLRIQEGDLKSIDAEAGLEFSGLENEEGEEAARIDIEFSYLQSTNTYQISVSQDQKLKIGGFAFMLKELELSFTPNSLSYPFTFSGELEIPGLENESGGQAVVGVNFSVPSAGSFTGVLSSNAVLNLGSVKITVSHIEATKMGDEVTIKLKGQLELEQFSGMGGGPAVIAVDIEIDNQGAFHVLGEVVPSTNAVKVVDVPNVVRIYLNKIGLSRTSTNDWDFILGGLIENQIVLPGMDDLLPSQLNLKELQFGDAFNIDLDIRWPSGLSIAFGGITSEATIPVNGKFGNAVSLDAIKISYLNNGALGVDLGLAFSGANITLGPVSASVEGLGIIATLSKPVFSNNLPHGGANFGVVNIDIEFKPPTGLGVSLDTPVFTGGGYLFFDREKGEYAGAVELSFMNLFAVSAIGIINSKMPDGKPGTSVIFIVSVEFGTGIALGFGFFLSGLGGILGIHRTIQVERLRDGVRAGTIQNILFPKDIIANINKILTDIKEIFPVKRDQFVLGPMAAITWGVPTILRVDLGVVIEFANPVRFGVLGVLRVILPDENAALIKIQVAFLGLIDFERGILSFDASLFDSKVLTFGLEGDMVLRISWGAEPDFVLSVGGFHPRYSPPTHLQIPVMKRMTLKILSGNPRLTLACYFAITSNTVQFGAGIDFYFGVSGFKIVGEFGFDVLFQFSPFRFIADARARLAVKAGSSTILSLSLEFSLEGPTPWRARGTAKFKVLFFTVKAKFDVTWGDKRDTSLPDIAVFPLLMESLEDIQNWRTVLGNSNSAGLRMKGLSAEEGLILTPNGSIEISQKIVPFDVEISKFGQFKPSDFTKFEIIEIKIGNSNTDFEYVKEDFAPANFLDLGDNEKLTIPSFNKENSGVKLSGTTVLKSGSVLDREVVYERLIMDEESNAMLVKRLGLNGMFSKTESNFFSRRGAISQSKLSTSKNRILNPNRVVLKEPSFAVVNTDDLLAVDALKSTNLSYMHAMNFAKKDSIDKNKTSIQVVASDILAL